MWFTGDGAAWEHQLRVPSDDSSGLVDSEWRGRSRQLNCLP